MFSRFQKAFVRRARRSSCRAIGRRKTPVFRRANGAPLTAPLKRSTTASTRRRRADMRPGCADDETEKIGAHSPSAGRHWGSSAKLDPP
jgi:hypothetical protein